MNNKDFSIFNVNIQDTKFRVEGNATYCDLVVKVNLNSFEQQFFQFTPKFVKKVISEHLPVVRIIANYCYSDSNPVVAKYYITPGGNAKVMAFNKKYYKNFYGMTNDEVLNVGDEIPVKDIVRPYLNECDRYDYCQTFTVTGKAICHPDDEFNQNKGELIASYKATEKAANRVNRLYEAIWRKISNTLTATENDYKKSFTWIKTLSDMGKDLTGKPVHEQ